MTSEQELRRFRRETAIWAHLVHDNIAKLYGTTEGFGPNTALVSRWFPDGTLLRLITEQGTALSIVSKLNLLRGIASGLYYLHSFPVVHGDIASSNVLVDVNDGEYKACLTDFGLSNVLGGPLKDHIAEGSTARPGPTRWTAPELLMPHDSPCDIKPATQNDMYSFGRVMFHVLTLVIPWHDVDEYKVVQKILGGEEILRPETSATTSDITDARWNQIEQCWSSDASARPSAFMAMNFLKSELEALTDGDMPVGGPGESASNAIHNAEQRTASTDIMHPTRSKSKAVQSGRRHTLAAIVNTVTLLGSKRGSSLGRTVTTDAGHLVGNTKVLRCIDQSRNDGSQASILNTPPLPIVALAEDLTGQIFGTINDYVASGAFGNVYRCEWKRSSGPVKV
ncbi:kinase-like domain-containing protein [Suillus subluteus]|nr:kinase-like domain-containing protein [Suillus subluteus]